MDLYRVSIAITITGTIIYHVLNKSVSPGVHPAMSLVATYIVALVASIAIYAADAGAGTFVEGASRLNWASWALGIAVTVIEFGFVIVYRAGWILGNAQLTSTVGATMLLIPIGIFVFHERLSPSQILGIALALIGMILMSRR
jgi:drug/metabolite transporter (DMT)-like permease